MSEWPLDIGGRQFRPIPESWIHHPHAVDHDEAAPESAVRLYAVSAAISETGRALFVRYLHPDGTGVLELETGACPAPNGEDRVPCGLMPPVSNPWPRSYVPNRHQEPDDRHRVAERDHLLELWGEHLGIDDGQDQVVADGGRAVRHLFDVEQDHLSPRYWRCQQ
jgi:hypothetical protein